MEFSVFFLHFYQNNVKRTQFYGIIRTSCKKKAKIVQLEVRHGGYYEEYSFKEIIKRNLSL